MDLIIAVPFILLLLSISICPYLFKKWWEKYYTAYSLSLALLVVLYYFIVVKNSDDIIHSLREYFSFIILLSSLYIISGGIFLKIKGKATPAKNVIFLAIGAIVANLFGTTGAAMLLIRPFINSNKYHIKPYHIVFFIFIVCNVGGSLTPVGDPPLFLGYLKGIPFFWITNKMIFYWFITNSYLLLVFYIIDKINFGKIKKTLKEEIESKGEDIYFKGIFNFVLLFIIIGAVFITGPPFLREFIMILVALISTRFTNKDIYSRNKFSYEPIKEVAILFLAIFVTMVPALSLVSKNAVNLNIGNTGSLFWLVGFFTSILDNAPTYLNFLTASMSLQNLSVNNPVDVVKFFQNFTDFVVVISLSSVFFGAFTYIGNGPNFMVKFIAENKNVKMPGFMQYIYKYSLPILLPFMFVLYILFFN